MKLLKTLLVLFSLLTTTSPTRAQYYDWGEEPFSVRWLRVQTDHGALVYPRNFHNQAVRMMHYINFISHGISHGYDYGMMRLPTLIHAQNFNSNGIVMLAPDRMEIVGIPPADTYATPWLKQLTAHESRHRVQFKNLNQNVIGAFGKIFGSHGTILGLAFMPLWAIEGDAVDAETQLTDFGRALQPSFTIEYRAMLLEGNAASYRPDKFFCGSFVDYMPDHYHVGYQVSSYAWKKYGENVWNTIADYGTRRPYQLFTTHIAFKKYYNTTTTKLFREAFADLERFWRSLPEQDNTSRVLDVPVSSYTTYRTPISGKNSTVIALKTDLDRTSRIVRFDPVSSGEKILHRTGYPNTGLVEADGRLWWTEFRQSTLYTQRVNSRLLWYNPETGRSGSQRRARRAIFPSEGSRDVAWVEYDYAGHYSINDDGNQIVLPDTLSVHGLTRMGDQFYIIGLSDSGMWIGSVNRTGDIEIVLSPGRTTLSGLRASENRLYFNSIESGKDEVHMLDPVTGLQHRLTGSRYGSFDGATSGDSLLLTTYTPQGYLLAVQNAENSPMQQVAYSYLPQNVVNPPRIEWKLGTVDQIISSDTTSRKIRKYRKLQHLLRFHSWAPVWYEPANLLGESSPDINIGLTILSQNLLNSVFSTLGYKYNGDGHFVTAALRFYGLPVKFEADFEYGTANQLIYRPRDPDATIVYPEIKLRNYFETNLSMYLPITFDAGYHYRRLTPLVEFEHNNARLFYPDDQGSGHYRTGLQKLKVSLSYFDNVRMAFRDFLPRWGYAVRATYTGNPFAPGFGKLWSGYARVYLPGIGAHHSLMLRTGLQKQSMNSYNYRQKEVFPRGARYNFTPERYGSLAVDYQLPVWYPDGGINSLLFFKRVRLNLAYDYARYRTIGGKWRDLHSYGADITLDIVPIRLPSNTTTAVTFTLHKATNRNGVVFGASFSLPI